MSEAWRLLERASLRAATLTEEERNAYAVCLKYGFDVPASEVVTILESLAESRSREGELVAALKLAKHKAEQIRDGQSNPEQRARAIIQVAASALAQGKKA